MVVKNSRIKDNAWQVQGYLAHEKQILGPYSRTTPRVTCGPGARWLLSIRASTETPGRFISQSVRELVLESRLPYKIVHLLFAITD